MYNNEDISKLFLVFKLAKFMLGNYTVLNLQIFELLIVFYSIFYASTLTTLHMYWYSRQTGYFIWSQIIHSKECNGKDNIILLRYRIIVGLLGICCIAASQTLLICICLQSIMQRWKLQKSSSKMVQLWVKLYKFSGLTHFWNTSWVFTNTAVFGCTPSF